jgi:UDPglucose 6-dehydrogenase
MHVAMVGVGYVGLVSGACLSEFGHKVLCVDRDKQKIEALKAGQMPIFEPGLGPIVARNLSAERLEFTTELAPAVAQSEAIFIAVGTPSRREDGNTDLGHVFDVAAQIAPALQPQALVVMKSTVPVGTGRDVAGRIAKIRPGLAFEIATNPEFLREGSAIEDFLRPDRVICGAESERAKELLRAIYRPLFLNETPVLFTTLETAELIKYAANAFLATKVAFINEIADLCEELGVDVQQVARGMGMDRRIGAKFLHPGPGFGGSCFPKDTKALLGMARAAGGDLSILASVIASNEARKKSLSERVRRALGGSLRGKTVAVLGLTFKPNTDDMRESPSLDLVPALLAQGARIRAFDPEGMPEARKLLHGITWCEDAYGALRDADAGVILTEWNQFRALDLARLKTLMHRPLIIDFRSIYPPAEMASCGITYHSVGRPHARS